MTDVEVNGIAHIQIKAGRYDVAREFYQMLLPFLDLSEFMGNHHSKPELPGSVIHY